MADPLAILKAKIIKTDAVLNLLAEKKNDNKLLETKLKNLHERYLKTEAENKTLESMLQEYKIQLQNNILQLAQIPELKVKYDNLTNKYNTDINDLQIKYQTANLEIEKYKTTNIDKAEDNGVKRKTQSKEILQLQNKIKHLNKQITDQKIEKHNCSREYDSKAEILKLKIIIGDLESSETESNKSIKNLIKENKEMKNKLLELQLENSLLIETNYNNTKNIKSDSDESKSFGLIDNLSSSDECDIAIPKTDSQHINNSNENHFQNINALYNNKIEEITKRHELELGKIQEKIKELQEADSQVLNLFKNLSKQNNIKVESTTQYEENLNDTDSICNEYVKDILQNNSKCNLILSDMNSDYENDDTISNILAKMKIMPEPVLPFEDFLQNQKPIVKNGHNTIFKSTNHRKRRRSIRKRTKLVMNTKLKHISSESDANHENIKYKGIQNHLYIPSSSNYISDSDSCIPNSSAESMCHDEDFAIKRRKLFDNVIKSEDSGCMISDSSESVDTKLFDNNLMYQNIPCTPHIKDEYINRTTSPELETRNKFKNHSSNSECAKESPYSHQLKSGSINITTKKILDFIKNNAKLTIVKLESPYGIAIPQVLKVEPSTNICNNTIEQNNSSNIIQEVKIEKCSNDEIQNTTVENFDIMYNTTDTVALDDSTDSVSLLPCSNSPSELHLENFKNETSVLQIDNYIDSKNYNLETNFESENKWKQQCPVIKNNKLSSKIKTVKDLHKAVKKAELCRISSSNNFLCYKNKVVHPTFRKRLNKNRYNQKLNYKNNNKSINNTTKIINNLNVELPINENQADIMKDYETKKVELFGSDCESDNELNKQPVKTTKPCTNKTIQKIRTALRKTNGSIYNITNLVSKSQSPNIKSNKVELINIVNAKLKVDKKRLKKSNNDSQSDENFFSFNTSKSNESWLLSNIKEASNLNTGKIKDNRKFKRPVCTTRKILNPTINQDCSINNAVCPNVCDISQTEEQSTFEEKSTVNDTCFEETIDDFHKTENIDDFHKTENIDDFSKTEIIINQNSFGFDSKPNISKTSPPQKRALKNVKKLNIAAASNHLKQLINCPGDDNNVINICNKFLYQTPENIARSVLRIVASNITEKPDRKFTPPAPIMTPTQRVLQGFMNRMEKLGVEGVLLNYLKLAELYLLHNATLEQIDPISRLYVAVCKQLNQIQRIRLFCCDAVYLMDVFIPLLYTLISNWFEIIPEECSSKDESLARVLVQIILSKPITKLDANLKNLRVLLNVYHGYKEQWHEHDFFADLFKNFNEYQNNINEFAILLFCKKSDITTIQRQITNHLIPHLLDKNNKCNTKHVMQLIQRIISILEKEKRSILINNLNGIINMVELDSSLQKEFNEIKNNHDKP